MADTGFRSDSDQTVKIWSALLYKEALKTIYFGKFVRSDDLSIIQTKDDLTKEAGDQIGFDLRTRLSGGGRTDDQDLEGYEEALTFYGWSVLLHLRANAVKAKGKMSMRRTKHNIMTNAKNALGDWMAEMIDTDTVLALSGLANSAIVDDDDAIIAAVNPSTNRIWFGGQTTGGVLEAVTTDLLVNDAAANLFGTLVISAVKRKAELATPKIRPVMVDGQKHYVMFIHPYQAKALKNEAAWKAAQQYANVRGNKNPIFSGALGVWDGVVVHEYERIETRLGTTASGDAASYFLSTDECANGIYVARALFCGAQAGVHAYGQKPGWYPKDFQYNRVPGVATDVIYNAGKTRFNSEDFGIICVDTAYVPD